MRKVGCYRPFNTPNQASRFSPALSGSLESYTIESHVMFAWPNGRSIYGAPIYRTDSVTKMQML
jgi:hypothetical protein